MISGLSTAAGTRRLLPAALAGVVCVAGAITLFGGPGGLLLAATMVSFAAVFARRAVGVAPSFALAFLATAGTVLFSLIVSWAIPVLPPLPIAVAICVIAASTIQLVPASPRPLDAPSSRSQWLDLLASSSGAAVWLATLLIAAVVGGSVHSWMMYGDTANVVLITRALIEDNGVALTAGSDPVPLTAALVAMFILPGRVWAGSTLVGDLDGVAAMWAVVIAVCCVLSGLLVKQLQRESTLAGRFAIALASLAPLSWFALGSSFQRGFVNVHLTLALLLAACIVVAAASRMPLIAVVALAVDTTLVLASWSPLALIPGLMLVFVLVRHARRLLGGGRARVAVLVLSLVQLAVFALALPIPSLFVFGDALATAVGGVFSFRKLLFAGIGALWLAAAVTYGFRRSWEPILGLSAIPVGGALAFGVLVAIRRGEETIWGYYTLKIAWMISLVLLVTAIALAAALVRRWIGAVAVGLAASLAFAGTHLAWMEPSDVTAEMGRQPLARIIGGTYSLGGGDHLRAQVLEHANARTLPWRTTDLDENRTLFWLIQMAADGPTDQDLRIFAYRRSLDSMEDLCRIRELMGPPVGVITEDPATADAARAACADLGEVTLRAR